MFSKKNKSKRGYNSKCKACHNEYSKTVWYPKNQQKQIKYAENWRKKNPIKYAASKYGVDFEESKKLFEDADGKCQICKHECDLCMDHCHTGLFVRGFLCKKCNLGLGYFLDSIKNLENAITYLKKYENDGSLKSETFDIKMG
jgi:hypothetical protein